MRHQRLRPLGAWDLRHPGLIMKAATARKCTNSLGMWPLKPDADLVGLTNALSREAPFWGGPGKTFSEATTHARPDPRGALVRRHQHRVRSHPLLRLAVRQQPGEVFDDFVLNGKGNLRRSGARASDARPVRTRRRATSCSTSRAVRSRPWPVTMPFLASATARSRSRPTGTRRRRSSSAQSRRRRQPREQGQRLLQRAGQALRTRTERRRHRHRGRQGAAVHRRSRAVGRKKKAA